MIPFEDFFLELPSPALEELCSSSDLGFRDLKNLGYVYPILYIKPEFLNGLEIAIRELSDDKEDGWLEAILSKDAKKVQDYLEAGIEIEKIDLFSPWINKTELLWLQFEDDPQMVEILMQAGVDINNYDGQQFRTPLIRSVINRKPHLTKILINAGADLEKVDRFCMGALCYAVQNMDRQTAKMLCDAGADIDNAIRQCPFYPHPKDFSKHIKLLIELGGDINAQDTAGYSLIFWVLLVPYEASIKVIKFLIEIGANIDLKDYEDKTVLDIARERGYDEIARYLEVCVC